MAAEVGARINFLNRDSEGRIFRMINGSRESRPAGLLQASRQRTKQRQQTDFTQQDACCRFRFSEPEIHQSRAAILKCAYCVDSYLW